MADPSKTGPPPAYPTPGDQGPSSGGNPPPPPQYQAQAYGPTPGAQPQPQYAQQPQPQYGQPQPQYAQPYAGQQQGYGGPMQTTVILSQPGIVQGAGYGPSPTSMTCPHCSAMVTTTTSKECGGMVWMVAGIICLIGLFFPFVWLGCCLIPFCIPSLYNTKHSCPNCQKHLGTYQQGGI